MPLRSDESIFLVRRVLDAFGTIVLMNAGRSVTTEGVQNSPPNRLLKYLPTTEKLALAMVIYPLAASEK
jgi:hypothetical protein